MQYHILTIRPFCVSLILRFLCIRLNLTDLGWARQEETGVATINTDDRASQDSIRVLFVRTEPILSPITLALADMATSTEELGVTDLNLLILFLLHLVASNPGVFFGHWSECVIDGPMFLYVFSWLLLLLR